LSDMIKILVLLLLLDWVFTGVPWVVESPPTQPTPVDTTVIDVNIEGYGDVKQYIIPGGVDTLMLETSKYGYTSHDTRLVTYVNLDGTRTAVLKIPGGER